MDDLRRRYLTQQAELGGAEVILGRGSEPRPVDAFDAGPPDTPPEQSAEPKWLRGAPPIPGPGLTITSADPVLLGNDLAALPTLEAVAER
ncbi:MAG: hypothetical protein H0T50_09040, partial [Gemmatimonadales bacterium]|nr:hypothetical protein [Gemmatimonadales bacterium]